MRIGYSEKETEKMVEQKKPIRFKTGLLNLADGTEKVFENVESVLLYKDASHLIMSGYAGEKRTRDLFLCHLVFRKGERILGTLQNRRLISRKPTCLHNQCRG
jgi:hypothetical protein